MKIRYVIIFFSVFILTLLYAAFVLNFSAGGDIIYSILSASAVTYFTYGTDQYFE